MRLFAVYLILLVHIMDTSIANVALLSIATDLRMDVYEGQWLITAFGVGVIAAIPFVPKLADWLGSAMTLTLVLFVSIASLALCGLANSFAVLVAARLVQGLTSGAVVLMSQKLLLGYVGPERRAYGLALWSSALALAPVAGPILGATIISMLSWRWLFLGQVPILIMCCLMIAPELSLRPNLSGKQPALLALGLLLLAALFLQLGTEEVLSQERNSMPLIATYFSVCGLAWIALTAYYRHTNNKLFDWSLFRDGTYRTYMGTSALLGAAVTATSIVYTLWIQLQLDLPLLEIAKILASGGLITGLLSPMIGKWIEKKWHPLIVAVGLCCMMLSFMMCAQITSSATLPELMAPRIVAGFGMAFCSLCGFLSVSNMAGERLMPANALTLFVRVVTANICLVFATEFLKKLDYFYSERRLAAGYATPTTGGADSDTVLSLYAHLHEYSFTQAMHTIYWICAGLMLILLLGVMNRHRRSATKPLAATKPA